VFACEVPSLRLTDVVWPSISDTNLAASRSATLKNTLHVLFAAPTAIERLKLVHVLEDENRGAVGTQIPYPALQRFETTYCCRLIQKEQHFVLRPLAALGTGERIDGAADHDAPESRVDGELLLVHHEVERSGLVD